MRAARQVSRDPSEQVYTTMCRTWGEPRAGRRGIDCGKYGVRTRAHHARRPMVFNSLFYWCSPCGSKDSGHCKGSVRPTTGATRSTGVCKDSTSEQRIAEAHLHAIRLHGHRDGLGCVDVGKCGKMFGVWGSRSELAARGGAVRNAKDVAIYMRQQHLWVDQN